MKVHQLIFRMDFQRVNTAIMDAPGTVIKILESRGEDFWQEYQDNSGARTIAAQFKSEDKSLRRQLTVEPGNVNFIFEHAAGIPLAEVEEHDLFGSLFDLIHIISETFQIGLIQRAGLRLKVLSHIGTDDFGSKFSRLYPPSLTDVVTRVAGTPNDYAIAFHGEADDRLSYRCHLGPYIDEEAPKHFPSLADNIPKQQYNCLFDIDFFELNFRLTVRPKQWARNPLHKCMHLAEALSKVITEETAK